MTSSWGKELRGWVWGEGLFFSRKPNCRMQHILSLAAFHTSPRGSWRPQAGVRRYQLTSSMPERILTQRQWHTTCTIVDLHRLKEILQWWLGEYLMSFVCCYKAKYLNEKLCSFSHKAWAKVKHYVICQSFIVWREYPKSMAERWCCKDLHFAVGMGSFVTIWDYTTSSIQAYTEYYAAPGFSHMEKV